jgi:hypothetical protein
MASYSKSLPKTRINLVYPPPPPSYSVYCINYMINCEANPLSLPHYCILGTSSLSLWLIFSTWGAQQSSLMGSHACPPKWLGEGEGTPVPISLLLSNYKQWNEHPFLCLIFEIITVTKNGNDESTLLRSHSNFHILHYRVIVCYSLVILIKEDLKEDNQREGKGIMYISGLSLDPLSWWG